MTSNLVPIRSNSQAPSSANMGLSPVLRMPLAGGDRGTEQTIAEIRKRVYEGMTSQFVNRTAMAIVHAAGVQQFDFAGEIRAIYEWVRHNIRFFQDVYGIETVRTAQEILSVRGGDCDCINSVLIPSLLLTIGHPVRLVTIGNSPDAPRLFSHIYCEVEINGQWIPLDAARRNPAFGKGPRNYFRKRIWSLTSNDYQDVSGLSGRGQMPAFGGRKQIGLGFYSGRTRRGRLAFEWGDLSEIIGSAGQATAQIITSLNHPQLPGVSYVPNPAGGVSAISPTGQIYASSSGGGVNFGSSGTIPNWMLYGGLALLGVLVLRK